MSESPSRDELLAMLEHAKGFTASLQEAYIQLAVLFARAVQQAGGELVLKSTGYPQEGHLSSSHRCLNPKSRADTAHADCGVVVAFHPGPLGPCTDCEEEDRRQGRVRTVPSPSPSGIDLTWMRPSDELH